MIAITVSVATDAGALTETLFVAVAFAAIVIENYIGTVSLIVTVVSLTVSVASVAGSLTES